MASIVIGCLIVLNMALTLALLRGVNRANQITVFEAVETVLEGIDQKISSIQLDGIEPINPLASLIVESIGRSIRERPIVSPVPRGDDGKFSKSDDENPLL